jgi:hypothetical protein
VAVIACPSGTFSPSSAFTASAALSANFPDSLIAKSQAAGDNQGSSSGLSAGAIGGGIGGGLAALAVLALIALFLLKPKKKGAPFEIGNDYNEAMVSFDKEDEITNAEYRNPESAPGSDKEMSDTPFRNEPDET